MVFATWIALICPYMSILSEQTSQMDREIWADRRSFTLLRPPIKPSGVVMCCHVWSLQLVWPFKQSASSLLRGWGMRYIAVQFEAEILLYIFDHRWLYSTFYIWKSLNISETSQLRLGYGPTAWYMPWWWPLGSLCPSDGTGTWARMPRPYRMVFFAEQSEQLHNSDIFRHIPTYSD